MIGKRCCLHIFYVGIWLTVVKLDWRDPCSALAGLLSVSLGWRDFFCSSSDRPSQWGNGCWLWLNPQLPEYAAQGPSWQCKGSGLRQGADHHVVHGGCGREAWWQLSRLPCWVLKGSGRVPLSTSSCTTSSARSVSPPRPAVSTYLPWSWMAMFTTFRSWTSRLSPLSL